MSGSQTLCLFGQFAIAGHDDEQVDAVEGMEILMNHVPNGLWGGEGSCRVDCHILVGELGTRSCSLVSGASQCAGKFVCGGRSCDLPNAGGSSSSLQFERAGAVGVGIECHVVLAADGELCLARGTDIVEVSGNARRACVLQLDTEGRNRLIVECERLTADVGVSIVGLLGEIQRA